MLDDGLVRRLRAAVSDQLVSRARADEEAGRVRHTPMAESALAWELIQEELTLVAERRLAAGRAPLSVEDEGALAQAVHDAVIGYGPLERLLAVGTVENISINGCDNVWLYHSDGRVERGPAVATSDQELIETVKTMAARAGRTERRFDTANPMLNLRLPDGSRLHAVMVVSARPAVTIRRHRYVQVSLGQLVELGTIEPLAAEFLEAAVAAQLNLLVCGGTNTGKTTLLRALLRASQPARLVVVEDDAELSLSADPATYPNVVELERREPNIEGEGLIDMATLVREALRMRPDRVIVGEVRGREVVPMLAAMSQGNDGSMCTLHADSTAGAFSKIAEYAAMAERLSEETIARMVANSLHLVVHLRMLADGARVVSSIREVAGCDGSTVLSNEVFAPGPDGRAAPKDPLTDRTGHRLASVGFDVTSLASPSRWVA